MSAKGILFVFMFAMFHRPVLELVMSVLS